MDHREASPRFRHLPAKNKYFEQVDSLNQKVLKIEKITFTALAQNSMQKKLTESRIIANIPYNFYF